MHRQGAGGNFHRDGDGSNHMEVVHSVGNLDLDLDSHHIRYSYTFKKIRFEKSPVCCVPMVRFVTGTKPTAKTPPYDTKVPRCL